MDMRTVLRQMLDDFMDEVVEAGESSMLPSVSNWVDDLLATTYGVTDGRRLYVLQQRGWEYVARGVYLSEEDAVAASVEMGMPSGSYEVDEVEFTGRARSGSAAATGRPAGP